MINERRTPSSRIGRSEIARYNLRSDRGNPVMFMSDGQWFAWEESDLLGSEIFGSDKNGREKTFTLDDIEFVEEK